MRERAEKARREAEEARRRAQEAENQQHLQRGAQSLQAVHKHLRAAVRSFTSIRLPRRGTEDHNLRFMLTQLDEAKRSLMRAQRGPAIDFTDPDLSMEDPDLET